MDDVAVAGHLDDVPRARLPVVGQVDVLFVLVEVERHLGRGGRFELEFRFCFFRLSRVTSNLISVEGPRAELEEAGLLVEREVRHVDGARTLLLLGQR